jgi:hypothetical protein
MARLGAIQAPAVRSGKSFVPVDREACTRPINETDQRNQSNETTHDFTHDFTGSKLF